MSARPFISNSMCCVYSRCGARLWVGQIVTFFVYRPPSRPLGSLTPTQPGRVTNPTQGYPGPPWEAPTTLGR